MAQVLSLHKLERDAYEGVARVLYTQGGGIVSLRQERILAELRSVLHVSQEQHTALISRVLSELERPAGEIDTSLVGDKEITMPVLSAFALKPAKVAATSTVPPLTKKRKTPAAPEVQANGSNPVLPSEQPDALEPHSAAPSPLAASPAAPKFFKFELNSGPGGKNNSASTAPVPAMAARAGVPAGYVSYFTIQPSPGKT